MRVIWSIATKGGRNFVSAQRLAHDVEAAREPAHSGATARRCRARPRGWSPLGIGDHRSDCSDGLTGSLYGRPLEQIEADGAGFRALGTDPALYRFLWNPQASARRARP